MKKVIEHLKSNVLLFDIMITLQYHQSQNEQIYQFYIKSDRSVLKDNFKVIAYPNNHAIDNFYFVTQQTMDNINYLEGNVCNKMIDEQGYFQCLIEFHDNKMVFQNQFCTISILKDTNGIVPKNNSSTTGFYSIAHLPTFLRTIYTDLSYSLGLIQNDDLNVINNNQLITYTTNNIMVCNNNTTTTTNATDSFNINQYIDIDCNIHDYWNRVTNTTINNFNNTTNINKNIEEQDDSYNNIIDLPPKKTLVPNYYYYQNSYLVNKNKNILNPADSNPLDFHKEVFDDDEYLILPSK